MTNNPAIMRAAATVRRTLTPENASEVLAALTGMKTADAVILSEALLLYDHIKPTLYEVAGRITAAEEPIPDGVDFPPPAEITDAEENLLFWGIHLMSAARDRAAFPLMIRLMSLPEAAIAHYLGDANTVTGPKLLAGTFNGDTASLLALIENPAAHEFARWGAFTALAFLTFDGRIEPGCTTRFLRVFFEKRELPPRAALWNGWCSAVALLGLPELLPLATQAFTDKLIDPRFDNFRSWKKEFAKAQARPTDITRFDRHCVRYIENLFADLKWVQWVDKDEPAPARAQTDQIHDVPFADPIRNPLRNIGRNDPCPCGSGKKFKKCCLGK